MIPGLLLPHDFSWSTNNGSGTHRQARLGTADGCDAVIRQLAEADVLVNNMGIFEPKPFEEIPDADWLRFFETNVLSGIRLSRHYVRGMRARAWGRIVFVSSESVDQATIERDLFKTARPSSVIQRFASVEEVAAMIAYVCSVPASATTGAALRVDGGVVRAIA